MVLSENREAKHCGTEVFYQNYGERGYVDVYVEKSDSAEAIEIKSDPGSNSANSIIRQFQRQRNNFSEGSSFPRRDVSLSHRLLLYASKDMVDFVEDSFEMFRSVVSEDVSVEMVDLNRRFFELSPGCRCEEFVYQLESRFGIDRTSFRCPYCNKEYQQEASYRKHVNKCFG